MQGPRIHRHSILLPLQHTTFKTHSKPSVRSWLTDSLNETLLAEYASFPLPLKQDQAQSRPFGYLFNIAYSTFAIKFGHSV